MQSWCCCNYCLFDFEAIEWLPAVHFLALWYVEPFYIDPDASIQTLHPNASWKTSVQIGGQTDDRSEDRDKDQYFVHGTLLSKMRVGGRYGLQLDESLRAM